MQDPFTQDRDATPADFPVRPRGSWEGRVVKRGTPQAQGSKRIGRANGTGKPIVLEANRGLRPWRDDLAALMCRCRPPQALTEPVSVSIHVYLRRPKSHYGTGRNAGVLKATAPVYATCKPDGDKVARAVFDAGTGIWWRDDSVIARHAVLKCYDDGQGERVEVWAWPVAAETHSAPEW